MSVVCRSLRALLGASASRACGRIGQLKKVNLWQLGYGGLVPIVSLLRCRTEQKVAGAELQPEELLGIAPQHRGQLLLRE